MQPSGIIKDYKPSIRSSDYVLAIKQLWTYDESGIIYNQLNYTYDGLYGYNVLNMPHLIIKDYKPNVKILTY